MLPRVYKSAHHLTTPTILSNPPGVDASDEFNPVHSEEAKKLLQKFKIGTLSGAKKPVKKPAAAAATATAAAVAPAAAVSAAAPAGTAAAAAAAAVMAEVHELRPQAPPPPAAPASAVGAVLDAAAASLAAAPVTLVDPRVRYDLPLESSQRLNHDTYLMRFALPSPAHRVGLPCGKHVFLFAGDWVGGVRQDWCSKALL